jgi:hypothetical protein
LVVLEGRIGGKAGFSGDATYPGAHGISLLRRLNEEKQIEHKDAEATEETEIYEGDEGITKTEFD